MRKLPVWKREISNFHLRAWAQYFIGDTDVTSAETLAGMIIRKLPKPSSAKAIDRVQPIAREVWDERRAAKAQLIERVDFILASADAREFDPVTLAVAIFRILYPNQKNDWQIPVICGQIAQSMYMPNAPRMLQ